METIKWIDGTTENGLICAKSEDGYFEIFPRYHDNSDMWLILRTPFGIIEIDGGLNLEASKTKAEKFIEFVKTLAPKEEEK